MNELSQVFESVNIGLVVIDKDHTVRHWNRWMFLHSGIAQEQIIGASIFDFFPDLNSPKFLRNCKTVLTFGNFSFFSQKLHHFLFPFKPVGSFDTKFEYMQQSCSMGPLRGEDNSMTSVFLIVQDVTELAAYEQRLIEMNIKDALTGVYNRRYLETRLKEECERHRRHARKLSLVMVDIDYFKKVNDTYGHQCGDFVLKGVSAEIASHIRITDCLARYGGEEFCCLLPETELTNAITLAERFRILVESLNLTYQNTNQVNVTISLGVSELADNDSPESLLKKADEALYEAKRTGRNRVVVES